MKKNLRIRKTLSIKQFITEFGENFSDHLKQRLLELGKRCLLTRQQNNYTLQIRHIEHTKYDQKEYAYGQFVMHEGVLYFSESFLENDAILQLPVVNEIYKSLQSEEASIGGGQGEEEGEEAIQGKKIDDSNIDYVIDSILDICPELSPEHLAILAKYK